jgi:hypothetical protein
MPSLAQELRATILALNTKPGVVDDDYKAALSTLTKRPLRKGETWRHRLLCWYEREAKIEQDNSV